MNYSGNCFLFCGVGGSGMSALAKIAITYGAKVYGSDRNYDQGRFPELYKNLQKDGIIMVAQDGSGISSEIDKLVVSSAIEPSIPDIKAALDNNIPIIKRAELLAEITNAAQSITVGGTNGKSTVTGMIGWMLDTCGESPTVINGGGMLNYNRNNAIVGQGNKIVVETDESDGTIRNFHADIAVLTNISEDHKNIKELENIFTQYLKQSKRQVLNIDCPIVSKLSKEFPQAVTYSQAEFPEDLQLQVPGQHNCSNAMAAISVAKLLGLDIKNVYQALRDFRGITSRLEVVGIKNGITIIDDFGHNPDKIRAGLKTLKENNQRLILMYQPHGYAPTYQHKEELISVFLEHLDRNDLFYMPDILYFGGSVEKNITSLDIINPLRDKGINAIFYKDKHTIEGEIIKNMKCGDNICIMGARDDSLREMAKNIYKNIL